MLNSFLFLERAIMEVNTIYHFPRALLYHSDMLRNYNWIFTINKCWETCFLFRSIHVSVSFFASLLVNRISVAASENRKIAFQVGKDKPLKVHRPQNYQPILGIWKTKCLPSQTCFASNLNSFYISKTNRFSKEHVYVSKKSDESKAATGQSSVKDLGMTFRQTFQCFLCFICICCIYCSYLFMCFCLYFLYLLQPLFVSLFIHLKFSSIVSLPTPLACGLHFLAGGSTLFRKHESNNEGRNFQASLIGIVKELGQFQTPREIQPRKQMFRYAKAWMKLILLKT